MAHPRLRTLALVLGGVAVGVGVSVGASTLGSEDQQRPTSFGRAPAAEGDRPLLDRDAALAATGPRTRAGSPQEAVEAFLAAERDRDYTASYGYLTDPVRAEYGSPASWAADHPDALPPVLGFEVTGETTGGGGRAQVPTLTRYRSSLDAVTGLVAAQARTSWVVVEEDGGWAVDAEATTQEPVLPPDADAVVAVQAWAGQAQRCAPEATRGLRGSDELALGLCGAPGAVTATGVRSLDQIDAPPLQTSYGADVVSWARTVAVDGPVPLRAVVAPLDDAWRVVGVLPPAKR